jgi:ribosomal protein L17
MANRKLGRTTDIRMSMLKNLTTDLIWHEKIVTTEARAKEVKSIADSLISLAVKEAKNFKEVDDYKSIQNFYVFKVLDLDEKSETGYYGMFINKAYA